MNIKIQSDLTMLQDTKSTHKMNCFSILRLTVFNIFKVNLICNYPYNGFTKIRISNKLSNIRKKLMC